MKYLWFALLLMLSGSIRASEYYWVGNTSAWATLGNWRIGSTSGTVPTVLPGSADNVFITAGSAPIIQLSAAANIGGPCQNQR